MNKNSVPILLFALVFVLAATSGFAQMTVNETFRHDSAPNWIFDGAAHLTSSAEDPTDDGWLRLTGIALDQAGSAIYNVAFSSTDGVQITFWYATYGGTHADGISFYLIDGATLVPTVGGTGGALGYCWRHDDPAKLHSGVTNGYVGIGLDEWGNYVNSTGNYYGTGGYAPGLHPGIGIRGPGNLDDVGTFPYLAYVAATIETGSRSTPKKCEITITPSPTQHITVKINDVTYINNYDISGYAMPATLKMGFGSSTGNSTNYHEIRDLTVGGANPSMTTLVSAPDPSFIGQSVTLTATVSPGDATGTVFFYDGASLIGSATLVGAVATMSTSSLTIGTHNLSAVYQGDHKYASSQGTDTHEVLNLPEIDIQRPAGSTISDGGTDNIGEILLDGPVYLQYTICNQVGAQLVIPAGGVTAANMNNCSSFNVITSLPLYIDAGNCSTLDISFIIDIQRVCWFGYGIPDNNSMHTFGL